MFTVKHRSENWTQGFPNQPAAATSTRPVVVGSCRVCLFGGVCAGAGAQHTWIPKAAPTILRSVTMDTVAHSSAYQIEVIVLRHRSVCKGSLCRVTLRAARGNFVMRKVK
jgi:hypothetical protein